MKALIDNIRGDLRDLYFFYYFASFGFGAQRDQFLNAQKVTQSALEKQYGTSQQYVNTKVTYLTVAEGEHSFSGSAKEWLRLSFDDLIERSDADGAYHNRLREYLVVLLAESWERRFRIDIERLGISTASDFWGSVVRLRNCLLHSGRVLDRELYDDRLAYLVRGEPISFTASQINEIVQHAFSEIDRLLA